MIISTAEAIREQIPSPVQDINELVGRIGLRDEHQLVVSDVPVVIGQLNEPEFLTSVAGDTAAFRHLSYGFITVGKTDELIAHEQINGSISPDDARASVGSVATIAAVDARKFMMLPPAEEVRFSYNFYGGLYSVHEYADVPHLDVTPSKLSYLCAIGPSTVFFPGYFDYDFCLGELQDSSSLSGVTFHTGAILRANDLMFHEAPKGDAEQPQVRALAILDFDPK